MSTKVSRTVWSGGKDGDNIKILPIAMDVYRKTGGKRSGLCETG